MLSRVALVSALVCGAFAQEGPSLVVHKTLDSDNAVIGRNLTVTIAVYNIGPAAAFDVELADTWNLEPIVSGSNEKKWGTIEPRGSVTHSFSLIPTSTNRVDTQPAKVTYAAEAKGEKRSTATSNDIVDVHYGGRPDERMSHPRNSVAVISAEEYARQSSKRIKEWITFCLLLVIPVLMPAYFWKVSANNLEQKRIRAKASAAEDQKAQKAGPKSGRKSASGKRPAKAH